MDHPPAHRQGVGHDLVGEIDAAQGVETTLGDRQVDRTSTLGRPAARVGTPLVHPHSVASAGEEAGEQAPGEPGADDGNLVVIVRAHEATPSIWAKALGCPPTVVVRGVERHRGEADDVRLARVDDDAVLMTKSVGDVPSPGDA